MQNLPTASPEEQQVVLKAAEQRYEQLGVPIETARTLFQNEVTKYAQQMLGTLEKEGQVVQGFRDSAGEIGTTLGDFWESLPPMLRQGLVNALIGGGVGALGGAGYGYLQGEDPGRMAGRGAGYGALAGAATPVLSSLLQKFSSDLDGTFQQLTKVAVKQMTDQGFTDKEAEQILLVHLQKTAAQLIRKDACNADKGDYHANEAGAYPDRIFADISKRVKKGKDNQKQRKVKKLASDLTEAVKAAKCSSKKSTKKGKKNPKSKSKSKKKEH